jgi:hypothetical protein
VIQIPGYGKPRGKHQAANPKKADGDGSNLNGSVRTNGTESLGYAPLLPPKRLESPPKNQLDYDERNNTRITFSKESLNAQMMLDNNNNKLEWHKTLRYLALSGGLMLLTDMFALLLKDLGFSLQVTAGITVSGLIGSAGGAALRLVLTRRWSPSRDHSDRRDHRPDSRSEDSYHGE